MQIFVLSPNPYLAANDHNNKHVVKMMVETAQLLSTAHHVLDGAKAIDGIYKSTHVNHPCAVWVRQSKENYIWTYYLGKGLFDNYIDRYGEYNKSIGKPHPKTAEILHRLRFLPHNLRATRPHFDGLIELNPHHPWDATLLDDIAVHKFARALPAEYDHVTDTVEAYRQYYIYDKPHIAQWYKRISRTETVDLEKPYWYPELI